MTFSDYAEKWREQSEPLLRRSTADSNRYAVRLLDGSTMGRMDLASVDNPSARNFISRISRALSPSTVSRAWAILLQILRQAQSDGLIESIPTPRLPRKNGANRPWLTAGQMHAVISAAPPGDKCFYWLLAETGMRVGEALALSPGDIDLGNLSLSINKSAYAGSIGPAKTPASERVICVSEQLGELLRGKIACPGNGYIFGTRNGGPGWYTALHGKNRAIMRKAGLEPVGFHAFRRGNATMMLSELDVPLKIAAMRLGHGGTGLGLTLGIYAQNLPGSDRPYARQIAEKLGGG